MTQLHTAEVNNILDLDGEFDIVVNVKHVKCNQLMLDTIKTKKINLTSVRSYKSLIPQSICQCLYGPKHQTRLPFFH